MARHAKHRGENNVIVETSRTLTKILDVGHGWEGEYVDSGTRDTWGRH